MNKREKDIFTKSKLKEVLNTLLDEYIVYGRTLKKQLIKFLLHHSLK